MNSMDYGKLESLILTASERKGNPQQHIGQHLSEQLNATLKYHCEFDKNSLDPLIDHLRSLSDITSIFDDKMMNTGNGSSRISLESLAKWLVVTSQENGAKGAIELLSDYLKLEHSPAIAILAISGIEPCGRIAISDSIVLIPFDELPPSHPKEALYPPFMKQELMLQLGITPYNLGGGGYRPPKAALVKNIALFPKSYQPGELMTNPINYLELYEACEFLTLFSNATPVPVGSWVELDNSVPCKQILGAGWSYPSPDVLSSQDAHLSSSDWTNLKITYEKFSRMTQANRDLLRIPIQRINQARRRKNCADKAIDQGVAFEALFLNDKSHKEQISFTFRLRASLLLGENYEQRQKLISFFTAFYSCRSQAAHTGKLDHMIKISHRGKLAANELLNESDELCIKAITKIIDDGEFPDWNKLMLMVGLNS